MPYTKETRIVHYRKDGEEYYSAQVKYKWPFVKIYSWEDFSHDSNGLVFDAFLEGLRADEDIKGLAWAKHIIDTYHNLCNNPPQKDADFGISHPLEQEFSDKSRGELIVEIVSLRRELASIHISGFY